MTQDDIKSSLRSLLSFLDSVEIPLVGCAIGDIDLDIWPRDPTPSQVAALTRSISPASKTYSDAFVTLTKKINPNCSIVIRFSRSAVCTSHVIGHKVIDAVPEHTVDITEWECHPLLDPTASPSDIVSSETPRE